MTDPNAPPPAGPVAQPWYKSRTILAILAAMILTVAQRYGFLGEVTQDQLIQLLLVLLPMGAALLSRIHTTTPVITATQSKAVQINKST